MDYSPQVFDSSRTRVAVRSGRHVSVRGRVSSASPACLSTSVIHATWRITIRDTSSSIRRSKASSAIRVTFWVANSHATLYTKPSTSESRCPYDDQNKRTFELHDPPPPLRRPCPPLPRGVPTRGTARFQPRPFRLFPRAAFGRFCPTKAPARAIVCFERTHPLNKTRGVISLVAHTRKIKIETHLQNMNTRGVLPGNQRLFQVIQLTALRPQP